jgi:3-O-methylgallate 3,4-dioxygenase
MADIVLGIGTSHTPQISVPWAEWSTLGRTQEPSPHIPPNLDAELQPDAFQPRHSAAQAAAKQVGQVLKSADLDAIVMFGDDQHEPLDQQLLDALRSKDKEALFGFPRVNRERSTDLCTTA